MKPTLTALALTGALLAGRASADLIEHYNTGATTHANVGGNYHSAQTFTVGHTGPKENFNLESIRLKLYRRLVDNIGNITVGIKNVNERGEPTGDFLTSQTIDGTILPRSIDYRDGKWFNFANLDKSIELIDSVQYAIQVSTDGDWCNGKWVDNESYSAYGGGIYLYSSNSGKNWAHFTRADAYFEVHGTPTDQQQDIIPEPTTSLILGTGLLALLANKRRKRKKSSK